jgi:hypothetical protein
MTEPSAHDRRQRRVLVGLALMFFAPLGVAFYLYYGHATWHPGAHVNAGDLIQPPRPLPPLALPLLNGEHTDANFLQGKWTLLYVGAGACSEICGTRLYDMRQVRLALDRDMPRVQRVFIAGADCCEASLLKQHPDLIVVRASEADAPLLALLGADGGRIYLIDPLGNLMMSYAPQAKSKGMLEDMKRLLRLSHIG